MNLHLTEQLPDLAAQGFDGAVWLWPAGPERAGEWTARRLARNRRVLVAAPAHLARRAPPRTPEDLSRHDCLLVREHDTAADVWPLVRERDRRACPVRVRPVLQSNSGETVRDWCLAGHGIMLRSLWDVAPRLARSELVRVLPGYAMPDADVHWLAPWQPRTPRRVQLLVDALASHLRNEPWRPDAGAPALSRHATAAPPAPRPAR